MRPADGRTDTSDRRTAVAPDRVALGRFVLRFSYFAPPTAVNADGPGQETEDSEAATRVTHDVSYYLSSIDKASEGRKARSEPECQIATSSQPRIGTTPACLAFWSTLLTVRRARPPSSLLPPLSLSLTCIQ